MNKIETYGKAGYLSCRFENDGTPFVEGAGKAGNLFWRFEGGDTLFIEGVGEMESYEDYPWRFFGKFIREIIIEEGVTTIEANAFTGCTSLSSITIPNSVIKIEICAFQDCFSLSSITIPNSVDSIGSCAFENCLSLSSIIIPDSVTYIGAGAFANTNWEWGEYSQTDRAIYINDILYKYKGFVPDGILKVQKGAKSISCCAFQDCCNLNSIIFPDSVIKIHPYAFHKCDTIESFFVDSTNNNYCSHEGVLFNKNKTELIKYPAAKPETDYSIPKSVTKLGDDTFSGCHNLLRITIPKSSPPKGNCSFSDINTMTCKLYVPKGSEEVYRTAEYWKDFVQILPIE